MKGGAKMYVKINISIKKELLAKLDKLANDNYFTRSGYIAYLVNKELTKKGE